MASVVSAAGMTSPQARVRHQISLPERMSTLNYGLEALSVSNFLFRTGHSAVNVALY